MTIGDDQSAENPPAPDSSPSELSARIETEAMAKPDVIIDKENSFSPPGSILSSPPEQRIPEDSRLDGPFVRPGIGVSLLWTLLLLFFQIGVGIAVVVVSIIVVIASGPIPAAQVGDQAQKLMMPWLLPVAAFSTVLLSMVIVLIAFRGQFARCMGMRSMTALQAVMVAMLSVPMAVLTSEFTNCISHIFPNMPMMEMFKDFASQPLIAIFIFGCLCPGFGEELYFRGFLSRGLVSHHRVLYGSLFAALLFGAIHIHPIQGSGAFMLGLILQYVFLITRSFWAPVILHTANNSMAFLAMLYGHLFPIRGFTSSSGEGIEHSSFVLVGIAFTTAASLLFALYQTRSDWLRPDGTRWTRDFVTAEGPVERDIQLVSRQIDLRTLCGVVVIYAVFVATLYFSVEV